MNRAERRRMMKKVPELKEAVEKSAGQAVEDLKKMFQKQWQKVDDDETSNEGGKGYQDFGEDDGLNF